MFRSNTDAGRPLVVGRRGCRLCAGDASRLLGPLVVVERLATAARAAPGRPRVGQLLVILICGESQRTGSPCAPRPAGHLGSLRRRSSSAGSRRWSLCNLSGIVARLDLLGERMPDHHLSVAREKPDDVLGHPPLAVALVLSASNPFPAGVIDDAVGRQARRRAIEVKLRSLREVAPVRL